LKNVFENPPVYSIKLEKGRLWRGGGIGISHISTAANAILIYIKNPQSMIYPAFV
jgi:hypothetical protein